MYRLRGASSKTGVDRVVVSVVKTTTTATTKTKLQNKMSDPRMHSSIS